MISSLLAYPKIFFISLLCNPFIFSISIEEKDAKPRAHSQLFKSLTKMWSPFSKFPLIFFTPAGSRLFLFFIASLTDIIDGYYARTYNLITTLGRYLDPIADKLFILSGFFTLYYILDGYIQLWMLLIIILRDIFVTLLRNIFSEKGFFFKTSILAKRKTLLQVISIHIMLLLVILRDYLLIVISFNVDIDY